MVENKYEIGTVVVLKSGSPRMCVTGYGNGLCDLVWFIDSTLHHGVVHSDCLKPAFEPECSDPCPDCGSPERGDNTPKSVKADWPKITIERLERFDKSNFDLTFGSKRE